MRRSAPAIGRSGAASTSPWSRVSSSPCSDPTASGSPRSSARSSVSLPPSAGSITVLGGEPGPHNEHIGYLPQRRSFDADLQVRGVDVVRLGLDGTRWGLPLPGARRWSARARADEARVHEVIELVDAQRYADRPIGRLSGGEQQRLLIAQALASRPSLLLLDEPLDSLDLPNQSAIAALISRICRDDDVTVADGGSRREPDPQLSRPRRLHRGRWRRRGHARGGHHRRDAVAALSDTDRGAAYV